MSNITSKLRRLTKYNRNSFHCIDISFGSVHQWHEIFMYKSPDSSMAGHLSFVFVVLSGSMGISKIHYSFHKRDEVVVSTRSTSESVKTGQWSEFDFFGFKCVLEDPWSFEAGIDSRIEREFIGRRSCPK